MWRLCIYFSRLVLLSVSLALVILVSIDSLVKLLDNTAIGWQTVALQLPDAVYHFFPYAALLGCLGGLGVASANNEVLALRSFGMGNVKLLTILGLPILIFALVFLGARQWYIPQLNRQAQLLEETKELRKPPVLHKQLQEIIFLSQPGQNGQWFDVSVLREDEQGLKQVLSADLALAQGQQWLLKGVTETRREATGIRLYQHDEIFFVPSTNLMALYYSQWDENALSLSELWHYAQLLPPNSVTRQSTLLAFWRNLIVPFDALLMVILGLALVLGPLQKMAIGARIGVGVCVSVMIVVIWDFSRGLILATDSPPWLVIWVPILLLMLAIMLFRRSSV